MSLLLSATLIQQPVFAAPTPPTVNQTVLSLAISPTAVTEPSGTTITATLTYLVNGNPVKGDNVIIQRAVNNLACNLAGSNFSNVYNAKTNNLGQISYTVTSTAGLGGKLVGFKATHPQLISGKTTNGESTSACQNLTINPPNLPIVSISQPTPNQQLTPANVVVKGNAAAGSYPLSAVLVSVDGGTATQAIGTTNWNKTLSGLANGSHTVTAQARDTANNLGVPASVTFSVNVATPPNNTPLANAGPDQSVNENTTVTLDGSASSDADAGDTLTYSWSQTAGPSVTLSSTTAQKPTFTAPLVAADTNLTFSLVVTDNKGASSVADTVNVLVKDVPIAFNHLPVVNAGNDMAVDEGTAVNLSGTATDPDSGDTLTISWTQVGTGPLLSLTDSGTLTPSFAAPQVDSDTQVTLRLNATDNHGASAADDITITIHNVVPSPIGSIRNVTSQVWTDNVGNMLITSSAEVSAAAGLDSAWIETFDSQSGQWVKRIENTANSGFNDVTCGYTSYLVKGSAGFADKNGCTAVPWGFEVWGCYTNSQNKVVCDYSNQAGGGNKKAVDAVFDNSVKFEGAYSAKMTGLYSNSTVVMAIPSYPTGNPKFEVGKPDIVPGETYRLEMMVKLDNVKGTGCVTVDNPPKDPGFCGFRIFQTFFDSDSSAPKYFYYGAKYTGTSDWFKVVFDAPAVPNSSVTAGTLVRGDPAIEIAGEGTVWIDALKFYSLSSASPRDLKIRDTTALNVTSTLGTVTYFAPGKTASAQNKNNELMFTEGTQAAGTYVYMWPDSEITISKWTSYPGSTDNIVGVTANIAYYRSYGGIATVTASVNGVPYPLNCVFDTTSTAPKVFTCDLKAAGIDTIDEVNNLTLKVKLNSASNGSIDSIKIIVDRPPVGMANTWVPVRMTWFAVGNNQKTMPNWRIGFSDVSGNVFHS